MKTKHSHKQHYENSSVSKKHSKGYYITLWSILGILIFGGITYALTVINDQLSTTPSINTSQINNMLYVQASNASDINATIQKCGEDCTVIVPIGDYLVNQSIYLRSNLTFINYGRIFYAVGATPTSYTDAQGGVYNFLFIANQTRNVNFFNYGTINLQKYFNPTNSDIITYFNNGSQIFIHGGYIRNAAGGYAVFNSNYINVQNVNSEELSDAVWQECTQHTTISNIQGTSTTGEGEAIDMNGYSQFVNINNVNYKAVNTTQDEVIDINANRFVNINNVVVEDVYRSLSVTQAAGIRFGNCTPINGGFVQANNVLCKNCTITATVNAVNSSVIENQLETNGATALQKIIVSNFTNKRVFDITHDITTGRAIFIQGDSLTTGYNFFSYSNSGSQQTGTLNQFQQDNAGALGDVVSIVNDGKGKGLFITQSSAVNGIGLYIDPKSNRSALLMEANETDISCIASEAGGIYYDGSTKKHYGCNSTTWNALY